MTIDILRDRMGDLWQHLGKPPDLIVFDTASGQVEMRGVHVRPWCEAGFVVGAARALAGEVLIDILERLKTRPDPVVVLSSGSSHIDVLKAASILLRERVSLFAVDATGGVRINDDTVLPRLALPWLAQRAGSELVLESASRVRIGGASLPRLLRADTCGVGATNCIVSVSCGGVATAFICPPGRQGAIEIGMSCAYGDDLQVIDSLTAIWTEAGQAMPLHPTEVPPPVDEPIEQLAVILDRTCCDNEHWHLAYALSVLGTAPTTDQFAPKAETNAAIEPAKFNQQVRAGAGAALKSALAARGVRAVTLWWAADLGGPGFINWVRGVDAVTKNHGGGETTSDEHDIEPLLTTMPYSPGLDLVDPIDHALKASLDGLTRQHGRRAVLVIGNSPPPPPPRRIGEPVSPLQAVLEPAWMPVGLRVEGHSRHGYGTWVASLDAARRAGIPIRYLFLDHRALQSAKPRVQDMYNATQQAVYQALAGTLPTSRALASEAAVEKGVAGALSALSRDFDRPGQVVLVDMLKGAP